MKILRSARSDDFSEELLRYAFVGGIAFLVDFGSLWVLTEIVHLHYLRSAALAFLAGLATNYLLSISWVFRKRSLENKWLEFGIFALVGITGLGLNELIIWFLTDMVQFHYLVSKLVSTIVVFFWNFLVRRSLLFR